MYLTKETVTTVKSNVLTEDKQQGNEKGKSYAAEVKYNRINICNDTVNLSEIYNQLLEDELNNTSKVEISPPKVCTNSASSSNASDSIAVEDNPTILSSQDEQILSILEEYYRGNHHLKLLIIVMIVYLDIFVQTLCLI